MSAGTPPIAHTRPIAGTPLDDAQPIAGASLAELTTIQLGGTSLAELTTIQLGGPARRLIEASTDEQLIETVAQADGGGEPLLVLGAGSNVIVADAGFAGTVVRVASRGVSLTAVDGSVRLAVAAGEPWAELVNWAAAAGLSGLECLTGIPGTAGATPIQNVGAYGQQVSDTIVSVRVYDREARAVAELSGEECGFAYRSSRFRGSVRFVVLGVTFELKRTALGQPLRHQELARMLGVEPGTSAPLADVGAAVLALRRRKGMVLDRDDPDSVSAGSFFVNPVMSAERFAGLEWQCAERLGPAASPPAWPQADGRIKTSAAWLIEQAGFRRGYGGGRVGISSKHTLALVNRGGATTAELLGLAREVRAGVQRTFGVALAPEPLLVGVAL